jgi:hypothetical protein
VNREQQEPQKQCSEDNVGKGWRKPARRRSWAGLGNRDFDYGFGLDTTVIGGYR